MPDVLKIYDSMQGAKVEFVPISSACVKVYGCGPTVYDRPHIGNIRSMLSYDVLIRTLRAVYPEAIFVRNITDVDDKIIAASKKEGIAPEALAEKYLNVFRDEMRNMNCLVPTVEPMVTGYIDDIIKFIELLIVNKHAYVAGDGVYFKVGSFSAYGGLSKRRIDSQIAGARVAVGEHKANAADFALWKLCHDDSISWQSPWGNGRPGWHIECSAMAYKELGVDFDIHCGGEDLKFPHHDNEIAQSRCAFPGSSFAKYWMHAAFIMFGGDKMSKSVGNVCYLSDIITPRINFEVVRYGLLSTHYRKPLNINASLFENAREALDRVYDVLLKNKHLINDGHLQKEGAFWRAMLDDLNVPMALAEVHGMVTKINSAGDDAAKAGLLRELIGCMRFLGLLTKTPEHWFNIDVRDTAVGALIDARNEARRKGDYAQADRLRDELKSMGVDVMDNADGSCTWTRMV